MDMHFCTHVTIVRQFGREMAQIQPPTHTLDPKPIYFCAEVFHILLLTAQNRSKWKNLQVRFRDEIWPGMVGLTLSQKDHKNAFFSAKGSSTTITTNKTIYLCKKHASIEKGSKGRAQLEKAREKKIDQKEQKRLLLLEIKPCTTCKYSPHTVQAIYGVKYGRPKPMYGHTDRNTVEICHTDTVIRRIWTRRIFVCTMPANPMCLLYFWQGNHQIYGHI